MASSLLPSSKEESPNPQPVPNFRVSPQGGTPPCLSCYFTLLRYRRPWRCHAPSLPDTVAEVPVHIIQRGNKRGACFFADSDYELYLAHLQALAAKFECAVHAYCLMTNHVHLLVTPREADGCARMMKHLGQRYVQHVNRTYRRSGTL